MAGTNNSDDTRREREGEEQIEEIQACQSCRKRKLKCSRDMPACSQCTRLSCPCVYDRRKQKPGLKSGAVESLNQRISRIEQLLLSGDRGLKRDIKHSGGSDAAVQGCIYHAALLIANSANRFADDNHNSLLAPAFLNCQKSLPTQQINISNAPSESNVTKRRRVDQSSFVPDDGQLRPPFLPHSRALDMVIQSYFSTIHPWLPCVHEPSFTARLENIDSHDEKLDLLIHAIICVTIKHLKPEDLDLDEAERNRQGRISRDVVRRIAMADMSVESLQALVIVASDLMGEGDIASAAPIIGSLTRTVEYLQLTIEADEKPKPTLLQPITLLEESCSWAEAEERRRVFWNVFILDRLCSIMAGWSTSLTSNDVRRRLPCDGKIWKRGESAVTPYFGIWDKSSAKMGNPLAYVQPLQSRPSSRDSSLHSKRNDTSPASESVQVGAFAYRIEATESLCQVTTFFLQQHVNFMDRQEVGNWLMRFKELDLRLVHWKTLLPPKWKNSNVSDNEMVVNMDPNLTLAHITHNASMILLHQHIAYPASQLSKLLRLPSSCSVETCHLAAIEISSISQQFLMHCGDGIVVAQFAFCAFIAGRVLLVNSKFYGTAVANEFFDLLNSLREMSRRWQGYRFLKPAVAGDDSRRLYPDLAARYVALLEVMHAKCLSELDIPAEKLFYHDITSDFSDVLGSPMTQPSLQSNVLGGKESGEYTNNLNRLAMVTNIHSAVEEQSNYSSSPLWNALSSSAHSVPGSIVSIDQVLGTSQTRPRTNDADKYQMYNSLVALPGSQQTEAQNCPSTATVAELNGLLGDELSSLSNVLLDHQFSGMDRVITLDGTDFAFGMIDWAVLSS